MFELKIALDDFCTYGTNEWKRFLTHEECYRIMGIAECVSDLDDSLRLKAPKDEWDFDSTCAPPNLEIRQEEVRENIKYFLETTGIKATFHYKWKRQPDAIFPEPFYLYALFESEEDALIFKFKFC